MKTESDMDMELSIENVQAVMDEREQRERRRETERQRLGCKKGNVRKVKYYKPRYLFLTL